MDFWQHATDDQIALTGCVVALAVSVTMMFVSSFVRRSTRGQSSHLVTGRSNRIQRRELAQKPDSVDSESTREAA